MSIITSLQIGAKKAAKLIAKESPTILTGLGVTGLVTTVILGVKATPKAMYLIELEEKQKIKSWSDETGEDETAYPEQKVLSNIDKVKIAWKCYIPAALVGTATIGCIIGANSINLRRNAVLASVYSLTEATLKEYQEKVVEVIGKNKEEKVREAIAQDKLDKNPIGEKEVVITGKGEYLFYDSLSGRYFKSDIENVRRVQNDFNYRLRTAMFLSLNEFYDLLELKPTKMGEDVGWALDNGQLDIRFDAKIAENGIPCIVLDYKVVPSPCTYSK